MLPCPACGKDLGDRLQPGKGNCPVCGVDLMITRGKGRVHAGLVADKHLGVIISLIAVNFAIFLAMYFSHSREKLLDAFSIMPFRGFHVTEFDFDRIREVTQVLNPPPGWTICYRIFTYMFIHYDFWHVALNMLALYVFGSYVVQKMKPLAFLVFYLLIGAATGLAMTFIVRIPSVGASAAVFGVAAAIAWFFPRQRIPCWLVEIPAQDAIAIYAAVELFFMFFIKDDIGHGAHLSGILFALLFLQAVYGKERKLFLKMPPPPETLTQLW